MFRYSLHHLTDAQKSGFLSDLRNYLKENGKIIIGDVAIGKIDNREVDFIATKVDDKKYIG